jgi:hypothetical protein
MRNNVEALPAYSFASRRITSLQVWPARRAVLAREEGSANMSGHISSTRNP